MSVKDLFQLDGKVALITGGSRGLGLQMAEALGEMGCRVAITARKANELAEAKTHLQSRGIEVRTIVNDLQRFEGIPARRIRQGRFESFESHIDAAPQCVEPALRRLGHVHVR